VRAIAPQVDSEGSQPKPNDQPDAILAIRYVNSSSRRQQTRP